MIKGGEVQISFKGENPVQTNSKEDKSSWYFKNTCRRFLWYLFRNLKPKIPDLGIVGIFFLYSNQNCFQIGYEGVEADATDGRKRRETEFPFEISCLHKAPGNVNQKITSKTQIKAMAKIEEK